MDGTIVEPVPVLAPVVAPVLTPELAPVVVKHPLSGGASLRAAVRSLRKRGKAAELDQRALVRPGLVLEARQIAAYAKICGFSDRQGVPFTFPHMRAFPLQMAAMLRTNFPFPVVGLVHLDNEIRQHERLDSGDRLDVSVRLGEFLAHDKGQAFTVLARAERGGRLVWESTSTYLRLGVRAPKGAPYAGLQADETRLATVRKWDLRADLGKRYAAVSGDSNPIHTSGLGARLLGFARPIAHGMWSKARVLAHLLPQEPIERARAYVAFKTPAFLPGGVSLLVAPQSAPVLFELRDRREQKPHLRGTLEV